MIADVAEELHRLARRSDDATGYFGAMYARVTSHIGTSITEGGFEDGERMDRFATIFAAYYTRNHETALRRSRCWQASFDVADRNDLIIVQHLLIGINAHVNFDLPQATSDVARAAGQDIQAVKGDFDAINAVLGSMTTKLLRDLDRVSQWANEAGTLGGGRLFNFSLQAARHQAWEAAQRLFALSDGDRSREVAELDRLVSVLAFLITEPKLPGRLLVKFARRFEEHDPKVVTATLLGEPDRR